MRIVEENTNYVLWEADSRSELSTVENIRPLHEDAESPRFYYLLETKSDSPHGPYGLFSEGHGLTPQVVAIGEKLVLKVDDLVFILSDIAPVRLLLPSLCYELIPRNDAVLSINELHICQIDVTKGKIVWSEYLNDIVLDYNIGPDSFWWKTDSAEGTLRLP